MSANKPIFAQFQKPESQSITEFFARIAQAAARLAANPPAFIEPIRCSNCGLTRSTSVDGPSDVILCCDGRRYCPDCGAEHSNPALRDGMRCDLCEMRGWGENNDDEGEYEEADSRLHMERDEA